MRQHSVDQSTELQVQRPKIRADCLDGPRPCPWVACKHHMIWAWAYEEKPPYGRRVAAMADDRIVEMITSLSETCVLDVADRGGVTLDFIAKILGITRERVRQIELSKKGGAIRRLRHASRQKYLRDFV